MKDTIDLDKKQPIKISKKEIEEEKNIRSKAKQILKDIGFKNCYIGFKYWVEAMVICSKYSEYERIKMMDLYDIISQKYRTGSKSVERNMRYVCSKLNLKQYFNYQYHINNTDLLFLLKDKLETSLN